MTFSNKQIGILLLSITIVSQNTTSSWKLFYGRCSKHTMFDWSLSGKMCWLKGSDVIYFSSLFVLNRIMSCDIHLDQTEKEDCATYGRRIGVVWQMHYVSDCRKKVALADCVLKMFSDWILIPTPCPDFLKKAVRFPNCSPLEAKELLMWERDQEPLCVFLTLFIFYCTICWIAGDSKIQASASVIQTVW